MGQSPCRKKAVLQNQKAPLLFAGVWGVPKILPLFSLPVVPRGHDYSVNYEVQEGKLPALLHFIPGGIFVEVV